MLWSILHEVVKIKCFFVNPHKNSRNNIGGGGLFVSFELRTTATGGGSGTGLVAPWPLARFAYPKGIFCIFIDGGLALQPEKQEKRLYYAVFQNSAKIKRRFRPV